MADDMYRVELLDSPFGGFLLRYQFTKQTLSSDPLKFFNDSRPTIHGILEDEPEVTRGLKYWICMAVTYRCSVDESETLPAHLPSISDAIINQS